MPTGRRRSMDTIMKKLGSKLGLSYLGEYMDLLDSYWCPESDGEEVPTDEYTEKYDEEMKKLQENVKKIQTFGRTEEK
jgi:hypothetical protein